jgi:hypothetical protein
MGEQHRGDIGAGHQQHQGDDRHDEDAGDQTIAKLAGETAGENAAALGHSGVGGFDAGGKGVELGLCLFERRTAAEAGDRFELAVAAFQVVAVVTRPGP